MKKFIILLISLVSFTQFQTVQAQYIENLDGKEVTNFMKQLEDPYSMQIFSLINDYRVSKGLPRLKMSYDCQVVCLEHSTNMAEGRVAFGHDGFDNRADWVSNAMEKKNPRIWCNSSAENVAMNQSTDPKKVVDQWLKSPGHRKNIENPSYTHAGLIAYRNAKGDYYYTQFFVGVRKK